MLGFSAEADADEPRVSDELEEARWFSADEIRAAIAHESRVPTTTATTARCCRRAISISRWLIEHWLAAVDAQPRDARITAGARRREARRDRIARNPRRLETTAMSVTLIAAVVALVLGHLAPSLAASVRHYGWYADWLRWLGARFGDGSVWRGRWGIAIALGAAAARGRPVPARARRAAVRTGRRWCSASRCCSTPGVRATSTWMSTRSSTPATRCRGATPPRACGPKATPPVARWRLAGRGGVPQRAAALVRRAVLVPAARPGRRAAVSPGGAGGAKARPRATCRPRHAAARARCWRCSTGRSRS